LETKEFRVSVIIPVYNALVYLEDAVLSATCLAHTGEVLLIDDGSSDGSLELCYELARKHPMIKVFTHQNGQNNGVAASRNVGIAHAKFEYISFLDSDDYYLPNRFFADELIFLNDVSVDAVYGCNEAFFENEEVKKKFLSSYETSTTTLVKTLAHKELFKALLFGGFGRFHTSAITIKKQVLKHTGLFNTELRHAEDSELWLKLSLIAKLVPGSIQHPISIRRVHNTNSIHQVDKALHYRKIMYQTIFDWGILRRLKFETKNDLFVALHQFVVGPEFSVKKLFWRQVRRNPRIVFSVYFIKKIYLIYLLDR
jgi:glycosyltransferase involved in cell wall biosynthesis